MSAARSQRIPRHDEYYIHGGDVVFCVDNTLFRVHRFFFVRDSSWFRNKLPYPLPSGETTKGSSDKLPFDLKGINQAEFERFLWVFYNPKYSLYDVSVEEWTSILKLAHEWNFTEVKELALRGLESIQIPAIQKIVLYQTYNVDRSRLQAAYMALTIRDDPITIDEGREVGLETVLQLAHAREIARAPSFSRRTAGNRRSPVNLVGVDLQVLVNRVFQLPSAGAESGDITHPSGTSTNARDSTQTQSTQTNSEPSSSPPPGTWAYANGTTNNGQLNGHVNGTANNPTRR